MITQKTINEIFETAKIEDVVGDFVNLRRRGANLIGLCPFHNEKTPSFSVSPSKGIYKCFGCGKGGNSVQFVMEHEQLSYPEALRYLAKKYRIELEETEQTEEEDAERKHLDSLYILNEFAAKYYQHNLFDTDLGRSVGLGYFKERGFREETVRKFGLGFAFDKPDALTLLAVNQGYNIELLKEVGLTTSTGRDFFRNRVQFPIFNLTGKVIGFGGRILVKDPKQPKYINTPESPIYNKSKVLYGIFQARKAIRQEDNCLLVEGYTDVISLHQAGVENVVASSGTSLTVGQIGLIKRHTPNITIVYDGDSAGIKAALRGVDLVLEQDLNVKIVLLPEGEDPDSYVQKIGNANFKVYLKEKAEDFILFKTHLLLEETRHDPIKRASLIRDIVGSIARIPDSIKRSVYIRECSMLMEIQETVLLDELNKAFLLFQQQKKKEAENEARRREKNEAAPPPRSSPSDDFDPFAGLSPPAEGYEAGEMPPYEALEHDFEQPPSQKKPSVSPTFTDEFQERDIVRLLMEFGEKEIEANVTVAEFLLLNMEEVLEAFDNPLYALILREAYDLLTQGAILKTKDFLTHPNADVQALAVNLLVSPYEYSENWEKKYEQPLQTQKPPAENFTKDATDSVNRFKLRKIQRLYEKNQNRLKEVRSDEELFKILKVQQKLHDLRRALAELTGTVILK